MAHVFTIFYNWIQSEAVITINFVLKSYKGVSREEGYRDWNSNSRLVEKEKQKKILKKLT